MSTPRSRAAVRDSAARWAPVEAKLWKSLEWPAIIVGTAVVAILGSVNDFPLHF